MATKLEVEKLQALRSEAKRMHHPSVQIPLPMFEEMIAVLVEFEAVKVELAKPPHRIKIGQ